MFSPISNDPLIIWPAVYPATGSALLSLQFQFEQSQWWSAEKILEHQLLQLSCVFRHAKKTVPVYKKKYSSLSFSQQEIFSYEKWLSIPIISRKEVQKAGTRMLSNKLPEKHGKLTEAHTSGSTGRMIKLQTTNINSLFWHANTLREHLWHKRDFSKSLAAIRMLGKKTSTKIHTSNNWGGTTEAVTQTGKAYAFDIRNDVKDQVGFLLETKPDYLLTYPSNALGLAQYFDEHKITPPAFLELRTLGEVLSDSTRIFCEKIFNARIVDMYSCQEAGYIALQCPRHNHYHVQSESIMVEVLNEQNELCEPGETGRVIISSLHNIATPLLRYDIGDFAQVGEECSCGGGHLVLNQVMGRSRNMLIFPDGKKNWPFFGTGQFEEIAQITQFQFIQKTSQDLVLRYVADVPIDSVVAEQLRTHIQKNLEFNFNIEFQRETLIERSAGGKFEDFISEVS